MTRHPRSQFSSGYLTSFEVARSLGVSPRCIQLWSDEEKLTVLRTLGGHRRFLASDVAALKAKLTESSTPPDVLDARILHTPPLPEAVTEALRVLRRHGYTAVLQLDLRPEPENS